LSHVQQGLKELQVKASKIKASVVQVSENQVGIATTSVTLTFPPMLVATIEIRRMPLQGGSLHIPTILDQAVAPYGRNSKLNLGALPMQTLDELH